MGAKKAKGDTTAAAFTVSIADYAAVAPGQRRRHMLDAAIEEIAENPLVSVTMERIAARAKVSRLKLYREFGNRFALIEAVAGYRLMLFDQNFFASIDHDNLKFTALIDRYLLASAKASAQSSVSRRWASGSMKFLHAGSLVHRTAIATWSPIVQNARTRGNLKSAITVSDVALWLIALQYSLGRMVVETGLDEKTAQTLVRQFILPAFGSAE